MKKQSFVTGAIILMVANTVSKILGALFKIPLTYILEEDGMAIYNTAFSVYVMFLSFVISGIPISVSKTVAQSTPKKAFAITDTAQTVLIILGVFGSVAMFFGADFFAYALKEPNATIAIKCVAPSVFFVALGCGCKNYFHGSQNMIPSAVSQVVEAIIKLAVGYSLALMFIKYGKHISAAGAVFGVTAGEIIATAILGIAYLIIHRHTKIKQEPKYVRELAKTALPLLLTDVLLNLISVTDTSLLRTSLLQAGLSQDEARTIFGAYSGYAMTLFNLPIGILGTIGVSLMPVMTAAVTNNDISKQRRSVKSGVELSLLISVPSAVMMWIIPEELLYLLFKNDFSAQMLKFIAPCVVTISLVHMVSALLQACGKVFVPSVVTCFGLIVKLGLIQILCTKPEINIFGAIISTNVAYLLILSIDVLIFKKVTKLKIGIFQALFAPLISSAFMAATVKYVLRYCQKSTLSLLAVCIIGGCVYLISMLIIKKQHYDFISKFS